MRVPYGGQHEHKRMMCVSLWDSTGRRGIMRVLPTRAQHAQGGYSVCRSCGGTAPPETGHRRSQCATLHTRAISDVESPAWIEYR